MKERAGDAGGDGDQVALPGENLDLASAGEFWEIDGASGADAVDGGIVGGDRGKVREELARVDAQTVESLERADRVRGTVSCAGVGARAT